MSQKQKKEMTIEEGFDFLDESVKKLSEEEISLEESFAVFEKGMEALKEISLRIDAVEKKVRMISGEGETDEFE